MQAIDGKTIRNRRRELNMTLEECCDGICSLSYLSMIENGKRSLTADLLEKFTKRLGLNELNAHSRFSQEALFTSGLIATRSERLAEAEEIVEQIPDSSFKNTLRALILERQGKSQTSISILRKVLAEGPEPLLFLLVANSLMRQLLQEGEIESVLEVGEFALRKTTAERRPLDDALVELRGTLATAYAYLGDGKRGIELTRDEALPRLSSWGEVVENWSQATVLMQSGEMTSAAIAFRTAYERMVDFDRPIGRARLLRSAVLCELIGAAEVSVAAQRDLDYALDVFDEAGLELDAIETRYALARLHARLGNSTAPIEEIGRILPVLTNQASVKSVVLRLNVAELLFELKDEVGAQALVEDARAILDRAEERRFNALAWNRLATIYEKLNDEKAAYQAMKKSLSSAGVGLAPMASFTID